MELSVIFKTLGDDTRLRILGLLLNKELCVCDIESVLEISQVNASRHLAMMKNAGVLNSRKTAQWVYYSISENLITTHPQLIHSLHSELKKHALYKNDVKALTSLKKNLSNTKC